MIVAVVAVLMLVVAMVVAVLTQAVAMVAAGAMVVVVAVVMAVLMGLVAVETVVAVADIWEWHVCVVSTSRRRKSVLVGTGASGTVEPQQRVMPFLNFLKFEEIEEGPPKCLGVHFLKIEEACPQFR